MGTTAALTRSTKYCLGYLLTADGAGGAVTIPNDAGVSPDLRTDNVGVGGIMRRVVRAGVDGIGTVAAGALNQAGARSLLLNDNTTSIGNETVPRCRTFLTIRTGVGVWSVDANVDGQGDPVITATSSAAAGTAELQIVAIHSIDR